MIPKANQYGNLPPGIHWATWKQISKKYGTTNHRKELLEGFRQAAQQLARAGSPAVYLDGSFVTSKLVPGDFDACWDVNPDLELTKLDPVFFMTAHPRAEQKARFGGELFLSHLQGGKGRVFLEFSNMIAITDAKGLSGLSYIVPLFYIKSYDSE